MADWRKVCALSELREGEPHQVHLGTEPVCLVRQGDRLYAVHDICTHGYANLSTGVVDDGRIYCPLHAGSFDLATGACVDAPVDEPVRPYPVRALDGQVLIDADGPTEAGT